MIRSSPWYELYQKQDDDSKKAIEKEILQNMIKIMESPTRPAIETRRKNKLKLSKDWKVKMKKMAECFEPFIGKEGVNRLKEIVNNQNNGDYIPDMTKGIFNSAVVEAGGVMGKGLGEKAGSWVGRDERKGSRSNAGSWIGGKEGIHIAKNIKDELLDLIGV